MLIEKDYYTTTDLKTLWGVSRKTVIMMIRNRKLSAVVIGGQYRVSKEQLQEYYKRNTIQQAP